MQDQAVSDIRNEYFMIYLLTKGDEERLQIAEVVARAYWPQNMRSTVLHISTPTHAASPLLHFSRLIHF